MTENSAVTRDAPRASEQPALLPPVDVIEDSSGITLFADLPGVSKDRVSLHLEAGTLTIEGEMDLDLPKAMEATHAEVGMPRYRRVFTLSKELDTEKLSAEMKQGVLRIHIQKVEQAKPRRIQVNVS